MPKITENLNLYPYSTVFRIVESFMKNHSWSRFFFFYQQLIMEYLSYSSPFTQYLYRIISKTLVSRQF